MINGKRFQIIELQIPAAVPGTLNRFNIGDQPQLRSTVNQVVTVHSLIALDVNSITVSPAGVAVVPVADFKNAYLVLNIDGREDFLHLPLQQLNNAYVTGGDAVQAIYDFDDLSGVDWSKSYILNSAAVTQTAHSYIIGVWYSVRPENR